MPDPSISTSSSSSSSSSAPGQTPSTFNQAQLDDLQTAEHIVQSARTEPFKTTLAAREITTAVVDALATLCFTARQRTAKVVREETAAEVLTLQATGVERDLVILLQDIQAAAKQKYARTQPLRLQDYFIGQRLNPNEATLHQNAFSIADLLTPQTGTDLATARDRLPGITLAKINSLRAFISLPPVGSASSSSSTASSSSSSSGGGGLIPPDTVADRAERDLLIGEINDRRMEIQFAADGAYPYTDTRNEEARHAFQLPLSRPFSG